jgi:citrate synthase
VKDGSGLIRGYCHAEIIGNVRFGTAVYLTLVGRLPSPPEDTLFDAMLTSLLDDGFVASTTAASRYVASGNPDFVPAVAGGLLAAGANTVSPWLALGLIDEVEALCADEDVTDREAARRAVGRRLALRERIPGLGHPIHKTTDFRAERIFSIADELGFSGKATHLFHLIHEEFTRETGKTHIPINMDGCLASVGKDLGLSARQVVAVATLSVMPGLMAHVIEEIEAAVPLRFIRDGAYVGHPYRPIPGTH